MVVATLKFSKLFFVFFIVFSFSVVPLFVQESLNPEMMGLRAEDVVLIVKHTEAWCLVISCLYK